MKGCEIVEIHCEQTKAMRRVTMRYGKNASGGREFGEMANAKRVYVREIVGTGCKKLHQNDEPKRIHRGANLDAGIIR
jgi:hypothetical protein